VFRIGFKTGKGFRSRVMKFALHSEITHCELNFSNGTKAAAWNDLGTGIFEIEPYRTANEWVYITLPYAFEGKCKQWFEANKGKGYNWVAVFGGIMLPSALSQQGYTCSEACYLAMQYASMQLPVMDAQRIAPSDLYQLLLDLNYSPNY
jgi:hypothetical protein